MKKGIVFFIFLIAIASCKSAKVSNKNIATLSARSIIKENHNVAFNKSSIRANISIKYRGEKSLPNLNGSMRIVRDSIIWFSFSKLGFPVAKLIITPDEVKFYEKITKTSFEGNFDLISNWLGTEFDFDKIQNLFIGETLLNLQKEKYQVSIYDNNYELSPKKRNPIFDIYYWIDPETFKLKKEEVKHPEKEQILTILYKDFNKINESLFPKGFIIKAVDLKRETVIDVNYRNVLFDTPLRFPFKLPKGYRNIELK
jgi:hypothetical protein